MQSQVGARVALPSDWGGQRGEVREVYPHRVTKYLNRRRVMKPGTSEDPALLIELDDGDLVMCLSSELQEGD